MTWLQGVGTSYSQTVNQPKILILNSYHQELAWTDSQVSAAREVLRERLREVDFFIEYMDTKRVYNQTYLDHLSRLYRTKYAQQQFDAIITTDDNALWFVEQHHQDIFGNAPVFFTGINDHHKITSLENRKFRGLIEVLDIKPTIDLATRLHPGTRNIVVIGDNTPTGAAQRAAIRKAAKHYDDLSFTYIDSTAHSHEELFESLRSLQPDSIVLLAVWLRDKHGTFISPEIAGQTISKNAPVPVYGIIDMYHGTGIVGGKLLSSQAQGRLIAEEAARILKGGAPGNHTVISHSANPYLFDSRQLERWQIDPADLPEGSIVDYRAATFFEQYRRLILFVSAAFTILLTMVLFMSINIMYRRKAERKLAKSEEKLRLVFELSPIGICTIDLDGNFVTTNPSYEKMVGYTAQELADMSFLDVTHPDYHAENRQRYQKMFTDALSFHIEKKYIRKDGTIIDVTAHATPIVDGMGNSRFGTVFVEDITERVKARQDLVRSKQLMDSVLNAVVEPMFVKDRQHRWIMINDAFCKFLGRKHEELLYKSDYDFFIEYEAERNWERDEAVFASDSPSVNELYMTTYGMTRTFSTSKTSFINPITGEQNLVGIIRDITDAKNIEEQLQQAQKMESVGRLAGGVAHDYNNISSIIIGYSELALEKVAPDSPIHNDLVEILTAAKRSTAITRQLLAFARKQTIAPRVLDLNDTVATMLKILQRLIGENIHLSWQPGVEVWPVKLDPSQIDQILANLCVNARDAISDVGKITIETDNVHVDEAHRSTQPDFVPGDYVFLAVSDNGSGMEANIREKIFEPFFTTKGVGKGSGLGLATVYGIVKQNDGMITVYSEPQEGTTIKIYLPRYVGKDDRVHDENQTMIPTGSGESILLVEDDATILKLGRKMIEDLDYRVTATSSPNEAVELFKNSDSDFDLLLTDVVMPEMNGRDLAQKLLSVSPGLKVIYTSGYTADVIANRGVLDDGVNFLPKPFSRETVAGKIKEVLHAG